MKKLFRILGITLLTVLYCFAISLVGDTFQNSGFTNKSTNEKGSDDVTVSIKFFSNTSQAESLVNPFSNSLPTTFKESKNEFSAILKFRELFFANEFSQYIFSARNFLIKYGKVNIIFPFHYFW
ncbi:MAG: hypothetical protein Q8K04_11930 [Lutibacter sp.]|nr:hypothetical protein [Lutibacter sp.]MDP3946118.1 hypothetical protein [Lutibacter sp.]